ncbi:MAG: TIGR03936 family radical SAM-associated protein [Clostridia bacterium]
MKIVVKYAKKDSLCFVSHIDTMRAIMRTLVRANLPVTYSSAVNHHMNLNCSHPLPLGVQSEAEYFVIECEDTVNLANVKELLNQFSPKDLRVIWVKAITNKVNFCADVVACEYTLRGNFSKNTQDYFNNIKNSATFVIEFIKREKIISQEVRNLIYNINIDANEIEVVLAIGRDNLRPDNFFEFINTKLEEKLQIFNIVKTRQYVMQNNALVDVESTLL